MQATYGPQSSPVCASCRFLRPCGCSRGHCDPPEDLNLSVEESYRMVDGPSGSASSFGTGNTMGWAFTSESHIHSRFTTDAVANDIPSEAHLPRNSMSDTGDYSAANTFISGQHPESETSRLDVNSYPPPFMFEHTNALTTTSNDSAFNRSDDGTLFRNDSDSELPSVSLMGVLLDVFFDYYHDLGRMFEKTPSEMKLSLHFPPSHQDRPHPILLHAICGASSFYMDKIPSSRLPFFERTQDSNQPNSIKQLFNLPDSFGEYHCAIAARRLYMDGRAESAHSEVELTQAVVIVNATFRRLGKLDWAFKFMEGAQRRAALLHLNVGPGFESLSSDYVQNVRVASSSSPRQEESRRNLFWVCYTTERIYAQFLAQSGLIDDIDVSQALPLRFDLVEYDIVIPQSQRQYVHSPNVLFNHPPELTDSFALFVKSAILLSRVRVFNRRFRMLNALGVPEMSVKGSRLKHVEKTADTNSECIVEKDNPLDARETEGFLHLETDVELFVTSFPAYLQEPIAQDGYVDWTLLNTYLASYAAKMILHEPHADLRLNESDYGTDDFACKSARKVVEALDDACRLFRTMAESVPDITLSDPYCSSMLYKCATICLDIIQKSFATSPASQEEIVARPRCRRFWDEFQFSRLTLQKIGTRLPVANVLDLLLDGMVLRLTSPNRRSSRVSS
ncbi:hypothetical protein SCHPADRAFT_904697 [Schizopora paradoxa]|uniref:Xylanolytic transcriptional activator regulatory domain-containing protein n=1 Tax=Schizopora paradoxa TaxID=27342 RepID=A0A0H2RLM3_9AGAM|nr:hypothetical protein SCHPADRAFT_904697 [Schizopora paradoxa]